jgi:hypothetical protein
MRRILLALGAAVLGLAITGGAAQAHGGPHGGHHGYTRTYYGPKPYYRVHGKSFKGGYYYPGRYHRHWEYRVWSPVYKRYHYWDPYLCCYFYYYPAGDCYYPTTYCP